MSIDFNFFQLKNVYNDALHSYDKTLIFDICVGHGKFLLMMFLSDEDKDSKDRLFIYMRNTQIMRDMKMYGSHKCGDFKVYISKDIQNCMMDELQLNHAGNEFEFTRFLEQLNAKIPLEIKMHEKVATLRNNRNLIRQVAIDGNDKTVLIGTRVLTKGTPQDKTLRKLYMYTNASEEIITKFIQELKKKNTTVAWTTEDNRDNATEINILLRGLE